MSKYAVTKSGGVVQNAANNENIGSEAYAYHCALFRHFLPQYESGDLNKNLVFFDHWSEADKAKHDMEDRIPNNFPLLYKLIMNLLGYEKSYPSLIQTEPAGREDELESFKYNLYLKHIQERTFPIEYKHQRSDIFQDANVCKFGCCEVCIQTDKFGDPEVYLKHIPWNQVMFDPNFSDFEMDECSRMQYFEEVYADDLIEEYPDKESLILSLAEDVYDTQRTKHSTIINFYDRSNMNKGKKLLRKYYDFKKELKDYHYVYTPEKTYKFDSKEDATTFVQATGEGYYKKVTENCWYKTVLVHDVVIEDKHVLEVHDESPLTMYFSLFINGEYTNVVEVTKDLQRYTDRIYSQIDYNMGVAGKVLYEINKTRLDKSMTDEAIDKAISRGGKIYTTSDVQVIKQNLSKAFDPQFLNVLDGLMQMAEDNYGGKNFQGVQQYSNQSGVAIEKLQAAAVLIATTYVDNLERFSKIVGRKLIKYISKFYTKEKSFKVIGDFTNKQILEAMQGNDMYTPSVSSPQSGYVTVNDKANPESKLQTNFSYMIKIVNKEYNTFEKENELQKLMLLQQQGLKIPPQMLMYFMNLDPIVTHELTKQMEADAAEQKALMIEQEKTNRMNAMTKQLGVMQKDKAAAGQAAAQGAEAEAGAEAEGEVTDVETQTPPAGDLDEMMDAVVNYI